MHAAIANVPPERWRGCRGTSRSRADDRFAKLPVYAVSADGEAMRDFEKKGFTGYMLKPITEDGLREIFGKVRRG